MRYCIRSTTKYSAHTIINAALSMLNACTRARDVNTRLRERGIVRDNGNAVTSTRDGASSSSACRPVYTPCRLDRRDHRSMTAALSELHWLPIAQRIEFKVLTLMHGAVHNGTPQYLSDRISTYTPARTLRSESQSLAVVPRINLEHYGRRAFSCAGPIL